MSGLFCPSCEKEHTSNTKNCEFCGTNLESVILEFKQKNLPVKFNKSYNSSTNVQKKDDVTGVEFYQQIKKSQKHRRKHGDKMLKRDLERYSLCNWFAGPSKLERECATNIPKPLLAILYVLAAIVIILVVLMFIFWI
ncbi:MAG: hypothetical protein ACTSPF_11660 [Candidatus Heimdallarchaeaceae archaeon]